MRNYFKMSEKEKKRDLREIFWLKRYILVELFVVYFLIGKN